MKRSLDIQPEPVITGTNHSDFNDTEAEDLAWEIRIFARYPEMHALAIQGQTATFKHLSGQHNQKKHGYRGGTTVSQSAQVTSQIPYSPDQRLVKILEEEFDQHSGIPAGSIEQAKKDLTSELAEIGSKPILIRVPIDGAQLITDSGRWKTQFETNTSYGIYDPAVRIAAEKHGFGTPEDIDPAKRPVYGYFAGAQKPIGPNDKRERINVEQYGDVVFELKPEVNNRSTMTQEDSMKQCARQEKVGTPAKNPGIGSIEYDNGYRIKKAGGKYKLDREVAYFEAQIHGGVSLKDVARVHFGEFAFLQGENKLWPKYAKLAKQLKKLGIEVIIDKPIDETTFKEFRLKHQQGLHNQKKHGWRAGKPHSAESEMPVTKPQTQNTQTPAPKAPASSPKANAPAPAPKPAPTPAPAPAPAPKPATAPSSPKAMTDDDARSYFGSLPLKDQVRFGSDFQASGGDMNKFASFAQDWKTKNDAAIASAPKTTAPKPVLTEAAKSVNDFSLDLKAYEKHYNVDKVFGAVTDKNSDMTASLMKLSGQDDKKIFDQMVGELAKSSGLKELFVKGAIEEWASTSNNSDVSATIQMAASDIFKSKMSEWQERQVESEIGLSPNPQMYSQCKKLVDSMYKYTQDTLKKQGIKEVKLYRGVLVKADSPAGKAIQAWVDGGKKGKFPVGGLSSNVIESWSLNPGTAKYFASRSHGKNGYIAVTIGAVFSASRILSSARTGFGAPHEGEFTVLKGGADDNCTVLDAIL